MKRWIALWLSLLFLLTGCSDTANEEEVRPSVPGESQTGDSADTDGDDPYVRLAGGVTMEMLDVEYWLRDEHREVVMTTDEIAAYNEHADELLDDPNGHAFALTDVEPIVSGDFVRHYVSCRVPQDPFAFYVDGESTDMAFWDSLMKQCNVDSVGKTATVLFGYSVKRTDVRTWPTDTFIGETADDTFYDAGVSSECLPYLPVCILHDSQDGEWYYCLMYGMRGWIKKECIAICESRDEWMMRQQQSEFLVVTGKELRLTEDPLTPALSNLVLPMGTKLPLVSADEAPKEINGRRTYGNYIVLLPVRDPETGLLYNEYALIPIAADVNVGYLPYTRENVLRQAFKLLGDRYGWAGMFNANDCSGIVHEIFSCFGLVLPRASINQQDAAGLTRIDVSNQTADEKRATLDETPAGALLYFPGHIMLYLGRVDGNDYVISATGSFLQNGNAEHVSNVVVNTLDIERADGRTWLEHIAAIQLVQPK